MEIYSKFKNNLAFLILLINFFYTTTAIRNEPKQFLLLRRQDQKIPSEYLTPPQLPLYFHRLPTHDRNGRLIQTNTPSPLLLTTTPESPGFFARLFGWTNAVSTTTTPQPQLLQPQQQQQQKQQHQQQQQQQKTSTINYQSRNYQDDDLQKVGQEQNAYDSRKQSLSYEIYSNHQLPQPPMPQSGQSYPPPSIKSDCNPCNSEPWTPINKSKVYNFPNNFSGTNNGLSTNSNNEPIHQNKLPPNNKKVLTTTHTGPLNNKQNTNCQNGNNNKISDTRKPDYPVPLKFPVPNLHMFRGALPPLYHQTKFRVLSDQNPQTSDRVNRIDPFNSTDGQNFTINDIRYQSSTQTSNDYQQNTSHDQINEASNIPLTTIVPYFFVNKKDNFTVSRVEITASDRDSSVSNQQDEHVSSDNKASSSDYHPYIINNQKEDVTQIYISSTESSTQTQNLPTIDSLSSEIIKIINSPVLNYSTIQSIIQPTTQSITHPTTQPPTQPTTHSITQPTTQSTTQSTTQPSTQSTTQLTTQSTTQPTTQSTTQPTTQSTTQLTTQSTTTVQPQQRIISSTFNQVSSTPSSTDNNSSVLQKFNNPSSINISNNSEVIKNNENKNNLNNKNKNDGIIEKPLRDAIYESYLEFLRKIENSSTKEKPKSLFNNDNVNPMLKINSDYSNKNYFPNDNNNNDNENDHVTIRRQIPKKKKQFQIIIPYTSQYKPSPFELPYSNQQDVSSTVSPSSTSSKEFDIKSNNEVLKNSEITEKILNTTAKSIKSTNTSIDHVKLQKNIDNWTILEYSTTKEPGSLRPQLIQSKSIPDEYLTTTEPSTTIETTYYNNNFSEISNNDLQHAGSSSVTDIKYSLAKNERPLSYKIETTRTPLIKTSQESSININDQSSKRLSVSIASLNNERVYVVTPQTFLKQVTSHSDNNNNSDNNNISNSNNNNNNNNNSGINKIIKNKKTNDNIINSKKLNSIEKAYQVLPEAVNNLEVASTGPAQNGLWGIMEHDQYASVINNSTYKIPVHRSGHS